MNTQKLLLTYYKERKAAFLVENNRLIQVLLETASPYAIGDIYIGRVKNIVKGMDAAFVELAPGSVGFLRFSHVHPRTILNRSDAEHPKCGDEILVQVSKEPHKTKEATLTTDISFAGRHLVFVPYSHGIYYSKKFSSSTKEYLRDVIYAVITENFGDAELFLQKHGILLRTNAKNASSEDIATELCELYRKASDITSVADKRTVFSCLYKEDTFFESVLNQSFVTVETEIITDNEDIYAKLSSKAEIRLYQDEQISLYNLYGLADKLKEALSKKVWLKCGGYLLIEPTEALTVIDVNSGKSTKEQNKLSPDEFHHRVNCDAVAEIVRQLRLRNISGIIIVDFLKTGESYNKKLLELLKAEVSNDPTQTVIVDMTPLGLVEITRKKTEASLYEKL